MLTRSRTTNIVHTDYCGHARGTRPWTWAQGRPIEQVRRMVQIAQLEPCAFCRPLGFDGVIARQALVVARQAAV